jgi:hypothetical protein
VDLGAALPERASRILVDEEVLNYFFVDEI